MSTLSAMPPVGEAGRNPPCEVVFRPPPLWKRLFDCLGASILLLVLCPLFVLLAVYIKLVSRGPIFFVQRRIGAGARDFTIYKFRTMHVGNQATDHRAYVAGLARSGAVASKPEMGGRLIPAGRLMRSLSLDELPQLINVIQGNMSLIGPRPEVLRLEDYQAWQLRRFEVLPGISGLWQVSGKNSLTFDQMVRLDIEYIDRLSFALDTWIAARTLGVVLLRRNH